MIELNDFVDETKDQFRSYWHFPKAKDPDNYPLELEDKLVWEDAFFAWVEYHDE